MNFIIALAVDNQIEINPDLFTRTENTDLCSLILAERGSRVPRVKSKTRCAIAHLTNQSNQYTYFNTSLALSPFSVRYNKRSCTKINSNRGDSRIFWERREKREDGSPHQSIKIIATSNRIVIQGLTHWLLVRASLATSRSFEQDTRLRLRPGLPCPPRTPPTPPS